LLTYSYRTGVSSASNRNEY